ncbi:MAG TPA: hypothetical protein VMB05_18450 [Solirubrobacteraceae bacterium]|nr:hypothetical protein [Solirubrobacteraceae bacterium]
MLFDNGIGGEIETFGAYLWDSVDHAFGGSSDAAAALEADTDPALSALGGSGNPSVLGDTTDAENSTLPDSIIPAGLSGLPWGWILGGVGLVVFIGVAGYALHGIAKVEGK